MLVIVGGVISGDKAGQPRVFVLRVDHENFDPLVKGPQEGDLCKVALAGYASIGGQYDPPSGYEPLRRSMERDNSKQ